MAAWAILQGSAFSGLGGGGLTATDLENGFLIECEQRQSLHQH